MIFFCVSIHFSMVLLGVWCDKLLYTTVSCSCRLDLSGAPNDGFLSDPLNAILGYLECL